MTVTSAHYALPGTQRLRGYEPIEVPQDSVEARAAFMLAQVKRSDFL